MRPAFNHQQKDTMQIANGFVTTCPENTYYLYGITPAEAVILKKMHNQYSNGSPLKQLEIVGEATEVDSFGKPLMIGERKPFKRLVAKMENGSAVMSEVPDFEMQYTPSTKPRTNEEEVNRLRRKYVGNVAINGRNMPAWEAAFGVGELVQLPKTFEEVRHIIGDVFKYADSFKTETVTAQPEAETAAPRRGRPPGVKSEMAAQ